MSSILELLTATVDLAALALLSVFVVLFALFAALGKSGRRYPLRPIAGYERLRALASQATESGSSVHVGLGVGQPESASLAQAQAALAVLAYLADNVAHCSRPVQATAGWPSLLPAAQGIIQRAEREAGYPPGHTGSRALFSGPDPLAWAVGAGRTLALTDSTANVMVGQVGPEALLVVAAHSRPEHLLGSDDLADAAVLHLAADDVLVGEEVLAAGAYLGRTSHLGSLAAQDLMRVVVMVAILVGALAATMGLWG